MRSIGLHACSTDGAVCPVVVAEAALLVFKAAVTSVLDKVWTVIPLAGDVMCTIHGDKGNTNDEQSRHHANHRKQNQLPEYIRDSFQTRRVV